MKPIYKIMYVQAFIAITLGATIGSLYTSNAAETNPQNDRIIKTDFVKHVAIKEWQG